MTDIGDLVAARYRLVEHVGTGSMGIVWRAEDELLRRSVAIKELRLLPGMSQAQQDEARRRTMREGRITARLHHPNAITVYDVAERNGRPCLVMEYLPSSSLSDLLEQRTLSVTETAEVGRQIAGALAAAHDAGIVHRDVKPGNVLLTEDGTAKLTDFGISHAVGDGTITASGVLAGTPAYLPPEVAKGQDPDFRSDVFSLGATLYAALEGQPPFGLNDNPIGMLHTIATKDIEPPKSSGALTATLKWMLQLDPAARPTMREAEAALAAVSAGKAATVVAPAPAPEPEATAPQPTVVAPPPVAPPPVTSPPPAARPSDPRNRRRALLAAAVVVVLAVGGTLFALLSHGSGRNANATPGATTTTRQVAPPPATTTTSSPAPVTTTTNHPPATTTTQHPPATTATGQSGGGSGGGGTATDPTTFIVDYYKLVPGDLAAAWPQMTPDYQQNHAGGWTGYQRFWSQFSSVSLSGVTPQGSSGVVATIHYVYKSGGTTTEKTSFGLVRQGGQWKIASSSVI
jgi:serine/threonine protein kinase